MKFSNMGEGKEADSSIIRVIANQAWPNLAVSSSRWQNNDEPILIAAKCIGRESISGFWRTDRRMTNRLVTNMVWGEKP